MPLALCLVSNMSFAGEATDVSMPSKPTEDFTAIQETVESTRGVAIMKRGEKWLIWIPKLSFIFFFICKMEGSMTSFHGKFT